MNDLMQSQIFFFISSVGFIILGILTIVVLIYTLRAVNLISKILKKAERDIDSVHNTAKGIIDDIRESYMFQFLFGSKRKAKK